MLFWYNEVQNKHSFFKHGYLADVNKFRIAFGAFSCGLWIVGYVM